MCCAVPSPTPRSRQADYNMEHVVYELNKVGTELAVDAARGAPPAATPAELRGGIADEALDRFVGTFLS